MSYEVEDFCRDYTRDHIHLLSPDERLQGLSLDERLKGLSSDQIQAYLKQRH